MSNRYLPCFVSQVRLELSRVTKIDIAAVDRDRRAMSAGPGALGNDDICAGLHRFPPLSHGWHLTEPDHASPVDCRHVGQNDGMAAAG